MDCSKLIENVFAFPFYFPLLLLTKKKNLISVSRHVAVTQVFILLQFSYSVSHDIYSERQFFFFAKTTNGSPKGFLMPQIELSSSSLIQQKDDNTFYINNLGGFLLSKQKVPLKIKAIQKKYSSKSTNDISHLPYALCVKAISYITNNKLYFIITFFF